MSNWHTLDHMIPGIQCTYWVTVTLACLSSVSTPIHGNHEVTQRHIQTEATHGHTNHELRVSLLVSNKYLYGSFWSSLGLFQQLTSHQSSTWQLTHLFCHHVTASHFSGPGVRHEIRRLRYLLQRKIIKGRFARPHVLCVDSSPNTSHV